MPENPYQTPAADSQLPPVVSSDGRPTLLRASLFGLSVGAILAATVGAGAIGIASMVLAVLLGAPPTAFAVGGIYSGFLGGGFLGALLGSPLAVAARLPRRPLGQTYRIVCLVLFAGAMGGLGYFFALRLTGDTPLEPLALAQTRLLCGALGTLGGALTGWRFGMNAVRFAWPKQQHRPPGESASQPTD